MSSEFDDLFHELQELDAKGRGFDDKMDMNRMICRVDCDSEIMVHQFDIWNAKCGTKAELTQIIQKKSNRRL